MVLRLRFDDFTRATRSHTLARGDGADASAILAVARELLAASLPTIERRGITLIGLALTNLADDGAIQLALPVEPRRGVARPKRTPPDPVGASPRRAAPPAPPAPRAPRATPAGSAPGAGARASPGPPRAGQDTDAWVETWVDGGQPVREPPSAATDPEAPPAESLDATLDSLRERYGAGAVTRAVLLGRDQGLSVPLLPD